MEKWIEEVDVEGLTEAGWRNLKVDDVIYSKVCFSYALYMCLSHSDVVCSEPLVAGGPTILANQRRRDYGLSDKRG